MNEIVNLINNVGFPIACCCYLLFNNDKMRTVIEENTVAITKLQVTLEKEKNVNGS